MSYYVTPLSMGSNQKNVDNFVWFKLLTASPTYSDGTECFGTSCMCFCLNPVFRYREDKSLLCDSFGF